MTPYYDDAILNFDAQISSLMSMLKSHGVYDNTIVIIYTDHGSQHSSTTRTPLLIHFPQDEYSGILTSNSQNLDIAPTILDYLHFEIPGWMEGSSLLKPLDEHRILVSVGPVDPVPQEGYWIIPADSMKYPYKQFKTIHAVSCNKITSVDLQLKTISESTLINPIPPCSSNNNISETEILKNLDQQFTLRGYPSFHETGILIN
jgi:arylsulfatase A-like enzyme